MKRQAETIIIDTDKKPDFSGLVKLLAEKIKKGEITIEEVERKFPRKTAG